MAEQVVDELEIIEIETDEHGRRSLGLRVPILERPVDAEPIEDARETVVEREAVQARERLLERVHRMLEHACELADLVVALDGDMHVEIAARDLMRHTAERLEMARDPLRDDERDDREEDEAEDQHREELQHRRMRLPLHLARRRNHTQLHTVAQQAARDIIRPPAHEIAAQRILRRRAGGTDAPVERPCADMILRDTLRRLDMVMRLPRLVRQERVARLVDLALLERAQDREEIEIRADNAEELPLAEHRHDVGNDIHPLRDRVMRAAPAPVPRIGGRLVPRHILLVLRQELRHLVPLAAAERRMLILAHAPRPIGRAARQLRRVIRIVGARLRQRQQRIAHDAVELRRDPRTLAAVREIRRLAEIVAQARRAERDDILRLHEQHIELAAAELRRAVHILELLAARRPRERREAHDADGEAEHAERAQAEREEFAFDRMKHKTPHLSQSS